MFFGMCNSPATFQAMMDDIFKDEKHKGWVIIYMDDIFVFTKELLDNIRNTRRVLQVLRDNDYTWSQKNALSGRWKQII